MDSDLHQSSAIQGQPDSVLGNYVGVLFDGSRERTHKRFNGREVNWGILLVPFLI